jgi:hypothetical protein
MKHLPESFVRWLWNIYMHGILALVETCPQSDRVAEIQTAQSQTLMSATNPARPMNTSNMPVWLMPGSPHPLSLLSSWDTKKSMDLLTRRASSTHAGECD